MRRTSKTNEIWTDREGREWPVEVRHEDERPKLVSFGKGGFVVDFSRGSTLSGYDDLTDWFKPTRWWTHDHAERRDPADYEGVRYIDKNPAVDFGDGYKMAISGPMVNVDLEPGAIDACPEPSDIMYSAMTEFGGEYGSLLTLQKAQHATGSKYGALDSVDTETYAQLWKQAGAVIGFIRNGEFIPDQA